MALRPLSRKAACCATVAASLRLHARYIQKCRFWIFCKSTVCEVFKTDTGNSRRAAHENKHLTLSFFSCNFIELLKRFAWKNSLSQIPFAKFDHKIVTILPLLFPDAFCRKVGQQFCTTVAIWPVAVCGLRPYPPLQTLMRDRKLQTPTAPAIGYIACCSQFLFF